jgi:histidyl-tRNA synthetase
MYYFPVAVYQIPRGTRDFAPEEMQKRRFVESKIKNTFEKYGYKEIQTPTFENLDLFTAKSGESIIDELYSFKDKGGRDLALRPELTAPVIRMYVEKMQMEPKPLKLFYFGNCFRYDRPQKGRYREFNQAGCEIIGSTSAEAISELIAMAYKILKGIGLKKIDLNIGNLKILSEIFKKLNLTKDQQKYIIPLIDKGLYEDLFEALKDFKISNDQSNKLIEILDTSDLSKIKKFLSNNKEISKEIIELEKITQYLNEIFLVEHFQIKMSIVRGLDYYTGTVFEIEAPALGAEKQLCGGGVYELISLFGGRKTSQAGFAIGFDRAILALELEHFKFPINKLDAYIVPVNENMQKVAFEIAEKLRSKNIKTDIDLLNRGIGKSLKYASSIESKNAIIVGPDEYEKKSVTIKDMNTGDQKLIKIKEITNYFN